MKIVTGVLIAVINFAALSLPAQAAISVDSVVVDVNFETSALSSGVIPNPAAGRLADLTPVGSPAGLGIADGLVFANTSGSSAQYLTGNLGTTTDMTKIVVEFTAKFPDAGCAIQNSGSMVFSLGSSSYVSYNIYRHSNFIGFNTFNSDIYGIAIPDLNFHSYKFVLVPKTSAYTVQEIYIDGGLQTPTYKTTSSSTGGCSNITGTGEIANNRIFTNGSYSNGDFRFMTHALGVDSWRTTGTVKNLKISTTVTQATAIAPGAPTINSVTAGDAQVSLAFTAGNNGGAAITNYKYSTDNGSNWVSAGTTSSPITITGLTNGTTYNFKLRAVNSVGDGTASSASTGTPKGNQTVTWAPTNTAVLTTASPLTPSSLATSNGAGSISYAVQSAGTTSCTVNTSSGQLTFSSAGSCVVRATAASTSSLNSATNDVTFTVTDPSSPSSNTPSSSSPTASPTPTPTATRAATRANVQIAPTPTESTATPNAPISGFSELSTAKYVGFGLAKPTTGRVIAVSGNNSIQPTITNTPIDTKIDLGNNSSIVLFAQDSSGETRPLNQNAVIEVDKDSAARVEVSGFAANSPVEVWLFSDPVLLGSGFTNSTGDFGGAFELSESIPIGRHSLQINGLNLDGQVTSVVVALEKLAPSVDQGVVDSQKTWFGSNTYLLLVLAILFISFLVFRKKRI